MKTIKKVLFFLLCVLGLLYLADPSYGGHLLNILFNHGQIFVHSVHVHGPHLRNPIGK